VRLVPNLDCSIEHVHIHDTEGARQIPLSLHRVQDSSHTPHFCSTLTLTHSCLRTSKLVCHGCIACLSFGIKLKLVLRVLGALAALIDKVSNQLLVSSDTCLVRCDTREEEEMGSVMGGSHAAG